MLNDINTIFYDIEMLTSKLLQREKLNFAVIKTTKFKVSSLILEALSKLTIEDESSVSIKLTNDFVIEADFYYLTITLKNLIDNAMKYSKELPIIIEYKDNQLYIKIFQMNFQMI